MYVRLYNDSNLNLMYTTGFIKSNVLYRERPVYLNLDGCNKIIFFYEVGENIVEYVRYYRELPVECITCTDIHVNIKNKRLIITQCDS